MWVFIYLAVTIKHMELFCFIAGVMSSQVLYFSGMFYKKNKAPLNNPEYFKTIWIITISLALTGLSTLFYVDAKPNYYLFLVSPLYSFALYRLMHLWFFTKLHRDPVVTVRERNPKFKWDELFQFCYLLLSTLVPMAVILGLIYPR